MADTIVVTELNTVLSVVESEGVNKVTVVEEPVVVSEIVTGLKGDAGNTWHGGTVDPTTEGVDGDWYLNRTTWHVWEKVSGTWTDRGTIKGADGAGGDMLKSVYDLDNDGKVDAAEAADSVPWSGVTGKPSTYAPSTHKTSHASGGTDALSPADIGAAPATHSHNDLYYTETEINALFNTSTGHDHDGTDSKKITWANIDSKPTTFTPSAHSHPISDVTNLQTTLDGKASTTHDHDASYVKLTDYEDADVLVKIKNVDGASSGLDADLLDGQEGSYYRDWNNITGKPTTLAGYGITDPVVTGPASATDNAIVRFDSTTGKVIQDSALKIDDDGKLIFPANNVNAEDVTFDGATGTGLKLSNANGYITLTPLNIGWAHIYTDRNKFIFNQPIYSLANTFSSYKANLQLQRNGVNKLTLEDTKATFVDDVYVGSNKVWHEGNDGESSGLNADLLDGNHASAFATASHTHDDRYFTETEVNALFNTTSGHDHNGTNSKKISWTNIDSKPSTYTPSAHKSSHATGGGDALSPSDIGAAAASHDHPGMYAPLGHTHNDLYYTESEVDARFNTSTGHDHDGTDSKKIEWANINGKPSTYTPSAHKTSHATGGTDALSPADIGAATAGHTHTGVYSPVGHDHSGVYAPASHGHGISDVTNLQTALDGKASTGHDHSGVYAPASHNHDGTYAAASHNHDSVYAAIGHNHDGTYAAASHNHDTVYLSKTNTTEYTPTASYHPATKKYVDDQISGSGGGDMMKSTYDTDGDGKVDAAEVADSVPWSGVTGKPSTYTPSAHKANHASGGSDALSPADIGAAKASHNHDGVYSPVGHDHSGVYSLVGHGHAISDVTNLQATLDGKASTSHNHDGVYSPVGHDHDLDYADISHNHDGVYQAVGSYLTDLVNDTSPQLGGDLDVNGKAITSASDGDIVITPDGSGKVTVGGKAVFSSQVYYDEEVNITGTTINLSAGNRQKKTMSDNVTMSITVPSGPASGHIRIIGHSENTYTISWPTSSPKCVWLTTAITSITAGKSTIISWVYDGTNLWLSCPGLVDTP